MKQDMILILDLGSEENPKIAREIRALGVYTEIHPHDITAEELAKLPGVKGIILNGGVNRVVDGVEIDASEAVYNAGLPILKADHKGGAAFPADDAERETVLKHFVFDTCKAEANWNMENFIADQIELIKRQVGDKKVLLALSGGVDSSVVAALLIRAIGKQLTCVHVNHGLLRKGEPEQVEEVFTKQFDVDFIHVHAEDRYAELLAGVTEPEEKRRIIGTQFWKEFFAVAQQLETDGKPVKYLAQGTIYPDIIESGARKTGGKTATIKSHHNLIPFPEGVHFDLIEPLDHFFKDEVRALGLALGLPGHIVFRQPFPGPGLAIRIIGAVDREKLEILKNADAIVREELDAYNQRLFEQTGERNSEHSCWQYFAVLPDIKSVGVMGDERTYQRPIILRAVESSDAMTADWAKLPYDVLARISGRIVAEVPGANRVCYDITSKPPATIEWE